MATQTDLQLLLTKGPLGSLPSTILNGRLAIGYETLTINNESIPRACLFIDQEGVRYPLKVCWNEILGLPEDLAYQENVQDVDNRKLNKDMGIATTFLGLAATQSADTADVKLIYNTQTQSLDFTFT